MAAKRTKVANKRSAGKRSTAKKAAKKAKAKPAKKAGSKKAAVKKAPKKKAAPKKAAAKKKAAPKKKTAPKKKASAKKKVAPKKKAAAKKKAAPKRVAAKKKAAPKKVAAKASKLDSIKKAAAKKAAAKKATAKKKAGKKGEKAEGSRRNFGLRGAAPWVARHAAKHAEELRRRNAEPPPPGSARATLRTPKMAEQIKSKIAELHQRTSKIRSLRKKLDKNFYEIGLLLAEVQRLELHEAKGFSSFEAFLDREVDLARAVSLRLIRITHTFQRETAYDYGLERLGTALAALDGEITQAAPSHTSSRGWSSAGLPVKPPLRFDD